MKLPEGVKDSVFELVQEAATDGVTSLAVLVPEVRTLLRALGRQLGSGTGLEECLALASDISALDKLVRQALRAVKNT